MKPVDIVWDMETNDPDDFLTLLFLLGHPQANLKAVTIFPGSAAQLGFVRQALRWFDIEIPIGVRNLDTTKSVVSQWHYDAYGNPKPARNAQAADEVLREFCDRSTTLLMGAPLTNLRTAIRTSREANQPIEIGTVVVQGGFAGEGVVPSHLQMEKFKGLSMYPTHNLIVDKKASQQILDYEKFGIRRFVSKNVCHRVIYDVEIHALFSELKSKSLAAKYIWQGMEVYLKSNPQGKMLHDVLAACCAIDLTIGEWREVELYRDGNAWGSQLKTDTATWIIIDYIHDKFMAMLSMLE